MTIEQIRAIGARECYREEDADTIKRLVDEGWKSYDEAFNEDAELVCPADPDKGFSLTGSQTSVLTLVYDPTRYELT